MHELTVTVDKYDNIQNMNVRVFVAFSQFLLSAEPFDSTPDERLGWASEADETFVVS